MFLGDQEMRNRTLCLFTLAATIALAACGRTYESPGSSSTAAPTPPLTPSISPTPVAAPLLTNENQGISFRYPADFNIVLYGSSMCFTVSDALAMACHIANGILDVSGSA